MNTICIANQKGGCGKTVTAINLAAALKEKGVRVLLVDMDPQAHATYGLGLDANKLDKSIYNIMTTSQDNTVSINQVILSTKDGFDLIPSHILLTTLEQELIDKPDAVSKLHNALSALDASYDFTVIDSPPSLGFLTFNGLRAADLVIIPVEPSSFSFTGVGRLLSMVELLKTKLQHEPSVRAVLTMFNNRTNFAKKIENDMMKYFADNLYGTRIRINTDLREAASAGRSIIKYDRFAKGAQDYLSLAEEVIRDTKKQNAQRIFCGAEEILSKFLSREVAFKFAAPDAKEVYIAGEFNSWQINENARLMRNGDGTWEKKCLIPKGRCRYKFYVDGNWINDPLNPVTDNNPFGGVDSALLEE